MDGAGQISLCKLKYLVSGILFGILLSKGGNPVIFADKIPSPQNFWELIFSSFPLSWLFAIILIVFLINLRPADFKNIDFIRSFLFLPFLWYIWQLISSIFTIDKSLTIWTILHFTFCMLCLLIGLSMRMEKHQKPNYFWSMILISFLWILYNGIDQHFGGLDEIRKNFEYMLQNFPQEQRILLDTYEFRVKIMSNRIFSVFVYPNTFAGALLLLTPILVYTIFEYSKSFKIKEFGMILAIVLLLASLACLLWTGSKAGWIIFVFMLIVFLWVKLKISKIIKVIAAIVIVGALSSMLLVRHADYFQKGAKSIGARFDYWNCAFKIALKNPLFGSGPGTFSKSYKEVKKPEAEMAKLAHNDYIEQASDSGFIGFLSYIGFSVATLIVGFRKSLNNNMLFMIWLGFFGWCFHGFFEFHLYIPALGWTAFLFAGIILSRNGSKT